MVSSSATASTPSAANPSSDSLRMNEPPSWTSTTMTKMSGWVQSRKEPGESPALDAHRMVPLNDVSCSANGAGSCGVCHPGHRLLSSKYTLASNGRRVVSGIGDQMIT